MSAFVVHDLKNLVAQLSLLLSNAARHRDNPAFQADMIDTVDNAVEKMKKLLLQLRAGATPADEPAPVDLQDVVLSALQSKAPLTPRPTIHVDAPGIRTMAHRERLDRVVGHLLQNAAEATPPGGKIDVRVRSEDQSAIIEVEDSGVGMSEDFIRTRLFKPFESTKKNGMGIGIYESREYIRELGGHLDVDEPRDRRHPILHRVAAAAADRRRLTEGNRMNDDVITEAEPVALRAKPKPADEKPVLLVVEDDPGIQKQMRWSFDRYDVVVAEDRASAMAQLRRYEPAVVTMDLGLPPDPDSTSEGFALLAEMLSASPDTKVIMITGQNDRTNAVKAIGLGAYDFYTKPFEPELLQLVDRPRVPPRRAAAREPAPPERQHAPAAGGPADARPGDAAHLPHDRAARAVGRHGAAARRERHRQGAAGARAARPVAAEGQEVHRAELRRDPREPARERAVRLRARRVHRRREADQGQDRVRRRGHAVPRRDRRPARARCRRSCCASCRSASSSASAAARRSRSTCASSARRTRT